MWYSGIVLRGAQDGRTIGFPTINLDPEAIPSETKQGVHAATVRYQNKIYQAALFYGARLVKNETHTILEIHIIDFDKEIYDQTVEFHLDGFIRDNLNFSSMEQLKIQIEVDVKLIKTLSYKK